jgi:hypothetical protein
MSTPYSSDNLIRSFQILDDIYSAGGRITYSLDVKTI